MDILLKNYNFYNMSSIAILFSGHLRNILNHIHNLQINLLNILSDNSIHYDIYIHTWDSNITNDTIDWGAKDQYYNNNINNIIKILKTKIKIKKILIENQNKKNIENQINNIMKFDINKRDRDREMLQKSYFQYYGFYKSLKLIDNLNDYNYIIKTRPDTYYLEKFNINLLNKDLVFPNSQLQNNTNINNIFFFGTSQSINNILNFFDYFNNNIHTSKKLQKRFTKCNTRLDKLFRIYILNILRLKPYFSTYNPAVYRNKNIITNFF
jgi:hypothetical protein